MFWGVGYARVNILEAPFLHKMFVDFFVLPFSQFFPYLTSENWMHRSYGVLVRAERSVNFHVGFTTGFWLFSRTDCLHTLNMVVAGAAIHIWQGSVLKESRNCVMIKLKAAQMEKIKVARVTFRHFLSSPCFALQTCLFILILHLYVRQLQNFKIETRTMS